MAEKLSIARLKQNQLSLTNNRIALSNWLWGAFKFGSKVWVWSRGLLEVAWYATLHMGWPLRVRRAVFRIGVKAAALTSSSAILRDGIIPSKMRREARSRSTCAYTTFADQTFADGLNFLVSYYKSPLDREEGPVGP